MSPAVATASYDVAVDLARDLVRITLSGFFDETAIRGFLAAQRAAHAELRCAPNCHLTIADVRGLAIQSQAVVARFHQAIADPAAAGRRLGFVTTSSLARSQLRRAIGARDAGVFIDPAEAEARVLAAGPATERAA